MKFSIFSTGCLPAVLLASLGGTASAAEVKLFEPPATRGVADWAGAKKFCESKGMNLATKEQLCPGGSVYGGIKRGNHWTAVAEGEHEWVQVGDAYSKSYTCKLHSEHDHRIYDWMTDGDKYSYENDYIMCSYTPPPPTDSKPKVVASAKSPSDRKNTGSWELVLNEGSTKDPFNTVVIASDFHIKRPKDMRLNACGEVCEWKHILKDEEGKAGGGSHTCNEDVNDFLEHGPTKDCSKWVPKSTHLSFSSETYFVSDKSVKEEKPGVKGDPHFITFGGEKYDFHGGCDLVLLQNQNFHHGLGMNIHVRTAIRTWWSFIESAVVQIGENTLQITGGKDSIKYRINGEEKELETGKSTLGDYAIAFRRVNDHQSVTRVDLGNHGDAMSIETYNDFVRVNIKDKQHTSFGGASGLLGAYPDGKKVGRDGKTVFEDTNEFGQEWMVKSVDRILFPDVEAAMLPLKCQMPDEVQRKGGRRRLGEAAITEEEAGMACARVSEHDFDACVFDVMATQDKGMASSY